MPNCTERGKPLPPRRLVMTRKVAGVRWSGAATVGLSKLVWLVRLKTSTNASIVRVLDALPPSSPQVELEVVGAVGAVAPARVLDVLQNVSPSPIPL